MGGGEHTDYNIEGIGNDFIADTMDMSLVDQIYKMNDDEAFGAARQLATAKMLIDDGARGNIVIILPDRGNRYFSKGHF